MWEDNQSPHVIELIILDPNLPFNASLQPTCIRYVLRVTVKRMHDRIKQSEVKINQKANNRIDLDNSFIAISFECRKSFGFSPIIFLECYLFNSPLEFFMRMLLPFPVVLTKKNFYHIFHVLICILVPYIHVFGVRCSSDVIHHKDHTYLVNSYHDWKHK